MENTMLQKLCPRIEKGRMNKVLTEEQIRFIESLVRQANHVSESMITMSTFAIEGLCYEVRTLQEKNKQLVEALEEMAESDDDWYVGRTPMKEYARRTLDSIQRGSQ